MGARTRTTSGNWESKSRILTAALRANPRHLSNSDPITTGVLLILLIDVRGTQDHVQYEQ